jgi:hypothetical protein
MKDAEQVDNVDATRRAFVEGSAMGGASEFELVMM